MVTDVISFNYSSIMSGVGFFGVFTAKGLKSVWPTRKDLSEMSLPDKGAASEETLQKLGCGSQESGGVRLICMCYERALSLLN